MAETLQRETTDAPAHTSTATVRSRGERLLGAAGFSAATAGGDYERILRGFAAAETQTPRRGLLMVGGVGSGKTMAARALYPGAVMIDCTQRDRLELLEADNDFFREKRYGDIILDDFGTDDPTRNYGNTIDFVAEFILWRYGALKKCETLPGCPRVGRLVITTNLDGEGQISRYGARVMDRIAELVVGVSLKGISHRKRVTV